MTWQEEILSLTIIYRALEHGDTLPLDTSRTHYEFVDEALDLLYQKGYLEIAEDNSQWTPTDKATELLTSMLAVYDQLRQFEIFSSVNLDVELPEDILDPESGGVVDYRYDPRFDPPQDLRAQDELNTQDLRLAMLHFLSELDGRPLWDDHSPYRFVFFQKLADGEFNSADIWFSFRAGLVQKEIAEIVETAYPWRDIAGTEERAIQVMQEIYTAGMLEQIKRDGYECSACGAVLGVFEFNEHRDHQRHLTVCPNPGCLARFDPPPPTEYTCPACGEKILEGSPRCFGCGAYVDFALPEGTVQTEEIEEQAPAVWHAQAYDFTPAPRYDPYDPLANYLLYSLLFVAFLT